MIYLDNAATTPICDAAKKAIIEHLDDFGNPSSVHELGYKARMLIEDARARIAKCINAEPDEIYFTSCGSEANTWALMGSKFLTSNIEHHSIRVTRFNFLVDTFGLADPNYIQQEIEDWREPNFNRRPFDIVTCMTVNNEIGVIQPIKKIAQVAHNNKMWFHTDAVQAVGHISINVKDINCDTLSASGHKFGAPKGVGFLYAKDNTVPALYPLIYGGKQERSVRGGTENVLGIIAMAAALEDAIEHMEERNEHIKKLNTRLLIELLSIDGVYLNGSFEHRVNSNINVRIDGVKGEDVVSMCDQYGICISAGSACNEGVATPSHVLKAIGLTDEEALSSIRITIGHQNTLEEINEASKILKNVITILRKY